MPDQVDCSNEPMGREPRATGSFRRSFKNAAERTAFVMHAVEMNRRLNERMRELGLGGISTPTDAEDGDDS